MIGGSDEALAQCLQAEEEARLRRCLDEEMRSEALARQLLQEEKSAQGNHTKSSFPNSKPLSSQLDEDERLARRLAEADGSTTSASSKEKSSSLFSFLSKPKDMGRVLGSCCAKCLDSLTGRITVLNTGAKYHHQCFTCGGCNHQLEGSYTENNGEYYHPACYETLFVPRCGVCDNTLNGKQYLRHTYFTEGGGYCKEHEGNAKSCFSCHRKEPRKEPFVELPDGRHVCFDCVSTAIFESCEAKEIYLEVVEFIRSGLGMQIPPGMREVPVLAVDIGCLNDQMQVNKFCCHNPETFICRGLTLSTSQTSIQFMRPGVFSLLSGASSVAGERGARRGTWKMSQPPSLQVERFSSPTLTTTTKNVTAVLVLFGLPRNVTASILAHEAMHVWCKLHPQLSQRDLPEVVEEGLCQLVAFKYLEHLDMKYRDGDVSATGDILNQGAWDYKLIRYNKFLIEVDTTPVYGEGFRKASAVFAAIGLAELLAFVSETNTFPSI